MVISNTNYLHYSYDNFAKTTSGNLIKEFHDRKQEILQSQLAQAKKMTTELKNSPELQGAAELVAAFTDSSDIVEQMYEATGSSLQQEITTGFNAGFNNSITYAQAANWAQKRSISQRTLNIWQQRAEGFANQLTDTLSSIAFMAGGKEFQSVLLQIAAQDNGKGKASLTKSELKIIRDLFQGDKMVSGADPKDYAKIQRGVEQLIRNIRKMRAASGKGTSAAIQRDIMEASGQAVLKQHNAMAGAAGEAAGALVAELQEGLVGDVLKKRGIGYETLAATMTGTQQAKTTIRNSPDLEELMYGPGHQTELKPASGPQKADVQWKITADGISFEFGISVKETTEKKLKKDGISIYEVSFLKALALFTNYYKKGDLPSVMYQLLNVAASHGAGEKNSPQPFKIQTPSYQINREWDAAKEMIASAALFYSLTGANKNKNVKTLYLIINGRAYRIEDIIRRVMDDKDGRVDFGQYRLRRSSYVALNSYVPNNGNIYQAAKYRSDFAIASIYNKWSSQKVNVTLALAKGF